jgi:hypothetical protein
VTKSVEDFNRYKGSSDGRQSHCRTCAAAYYRGNAIRHKANVARRKVKAYRDVTQLVWDSLLDHPCVDCGERDPVVLEFDHVDPAQKSRAVSRLIGNNHSWSSILSEIDKCQVRCANCHRRRIASQLGYYTHLAVAELDEAVAF